MICIATCYRLVLPPSLKNGGYGCGVGVKGVEWSFGVGTLSTTTAACRRCLATRLD